jgi:hypothetical protein
MHDIHDAPVDLDVVVRDGSGSAALRVAAVTLWAVVASLLGYGVLQTVIKASALFG